VSSEQLLVLVLLAAAFAAGWFARGGRADGAPAEEAAADEPLPVVPPPAALDPVMVGDADAVLDRAISAARAARAVALGPAGASEAATRAVLGVLDRRIAELEDCADRLEAALGADDEAFAAYDRAVSGLHTLRRRVDGESALEDVEDARAAWARATIA